MRFAIFVFVFVICGQQVIAQVIPDELAVLRARFEKKSDVKHAGIEALNTKYVAALERLSSETAKTGELDRVVEVKGEVNAFSDGASFTADGFKKRISGNRQLKSLQETYLRARGKFDAEQAALQERLVGIYLKELAALEKSLTKSQRIDAALLVKAEKERIGKEVGGASERPRAKSFKARVHFVAKAELEVFVNGKELRYRNEADNEQYTDVTSSPLDVAVGDSVVLRVRGDAVFRSVIFGMKATDKSRHVQFLASSFRLMGMGDSIDPAKIDAGLIKENARAMPRVSSADGHMITLWASHGIKQCQFIQPPEKAVWAVFGAVITEGMIAEQ